MADEPINTNPSLDPQAAVDAALTMPSSPVSPIVNVNNPEPTVPDVTINPVAPSINVPVPEVKQEESVPEEMLNAAPPVLAPNPVPTQPMAVSGGSKMADDTPLAFAGASLPPLELPTPTSEVPPLPSTPKVEPKLPEPAYVPPASNGESKPIEDNQKPKKKRGKGLKTLVIALFLLVTGSVAAMFGYYKLTGQAGLLAVVIGEVCTPGLSEKKSCTVGGCAGTQTRQCNSTGSGWGSWSSTCTKNVSSCGSTTGCTNGETKACTTGGCAGKEKCVSGKWNNVCVKTNPLCGIGGASTAPSVPKPQVSCKSCGGAGGFICQTVKDESKNECDSKMNTCDTNTDCGGSTGPQCDAAHPCEGGAVCGTDGKCVDPGGPAGCGFTDPEACTAYGVSKGMNSSYESEPGGKTWCDATGHWCAQTRWECKLTPKEGGNSTWCFMSLGTNCSGTVSDKCVSKPSPIPSPKPSPIPSPSPSLKPSPIPSPSPTPVLACKGINKDKADNDITKGSVVSFTCSGAVTPAGAVNLTYQFRVRKDSGAWTTLSTTGNKASYTVPDYGNYEVQCHTCGQINNASKCDPAWTGATQ